MRGIVYSLYGDRDVAQEPPADDEDSDPPAGEEGIGPRFKKGTDDLDQLKGVEKHQGRSRRARREHEQDDSGEDPEPEETYPAIDDIEKSKRRLKNRFGHIKDYGDAIDEFGS
jgi:hypothetical protein